MAKDLTTSAIERQNILNNPVALPRIQEALGVKKWISVQLKIVWLTMRTNLGITAIVYGRVTT